MKFVAVDTISAKHVFWAFFGILLISSQIDKKYCESLSIWTL
jgi:hypothetical protein